jgi:hypothetical protein
VGMRSQWKPTAMTTAVKIFMFVAETHMFLLKSQSLPLKSHFWISSIHHQFSRQNLFFRKSTSINSHVCLKFYSKSIWRFPEMGVSLNHPFIARILHEIDHPAIFGYPHDNGNLHIILTPIN